MAKISVVISCRNEADVIARTLQSLVGFTDDIIVHDNGSTDGTKDIIRQFPVHLQEGTFEGFGKTKNKAAQFAKYDWVLSLDADEAIDEELKRSLSSFNPDNEKTVYDLSFKTFLGEKNLKFGDWRKDHHIRLYNRKWVQWDDEPVHEKLILSADIIIKNLNGFVLHYTMKDVDDYSRKMRNYAMLNAEKYFRQGKRATFYDLRISPGLTFFNCYVIKLGFLDGYLGYVSAKMTAYYTFLKYVRLKELYMAKSPGQQP